MCLKERIKRQRNNGKGMKDTEKRKCMKDRE